MVFSPDKCEHIRITKNRKVKQTSYNIHGQTLNETSKAKYHGVIIRQYFAQEQPYRFNDEKGQLDYRIPP